MQLLLPKYFRLLVQVFGKKSFILLNAKQDRKKVYYTLAHDFFRVKKGYLMFSHDKIVRKDCFEDSLVEKI